MLYTSYQKTTVCCVAEKAAFEPIDTGDGPLARLKLKVLYCLRDDIGQADSILQK